MSLGIKFILNPFTNRLNLMKKIPLALTIVLVTLLVACKSDTKKETAEAIDVLTSEKVETLSEAQIEAAVLAAAHESWENARKADLDAMLAPMIPTNKGAYGMQGEMLWTTEAVAESYAAGFVGVAKQDIEMEREEITVLSSTSALYAGYGLFRQYDSAGELLIESPQAISIVYVLEGNAWKIRHMHQSFPGSSSVK
ncbi:nuclear transport factor 2 family protein [Algibacter mikhailovii]|uniref:SnoaL-like domain-containing protein n=1 Tax=Algibacter mikhailovii TaxID=425498 RepID=A0A918QTE5_9FLAO|nr:nuclear transport factor 2 family protein [Algibacter mikhailovii]GGZ71821.1 hypothetical protein GCM10007028_06480 [Algibacter mikhailovii]